MSSHTSTDDLQGLVTELRKLPAETGWVEFKENNSNPEEIGEYLSALSNAAALYGKANAYLVWGIRDQTHEVTGKPTPFAGVELIRVGSHRQKLKDYPDLERELWRIFDTTPFEELKAMERVDTAQVLCLTRPKVSRLTAWASPRA